MFFDYYVKTVGVVYAHVNTCSKLIATCTCTRNDNLNIIRLLFKKCRCCIRQTNLINCIKLKQVVFTLQNIKLVIVYQGAALSYRPLLAVKMKFFSDLNNSEAQLI